MKDVQRQKLYAAERDAERRLKALPTSNSSRVPFFGLTRIPNHECQPFADEVCDALGVKRLRIELISERKNANYHFKKRLVTLPPWGRNYLTILHEVAHHITNPKFPGHGPEFVENFILVLRAVLPEPAPTIFMEEFLAHGIEIRSTGKQGRRFLAYAAKLGIRGQLSKPVQVLTDEPELYQGWLGNYDRNGSVTLTGIVGAERNAVVATIPASAVRYATWVD